MLRKLLKTEVKATLVLVIMVICNAVLIPDLFSMGTAPFTGNHYLELFTVCLLSVIVVFGLHFSLNDKSFADSHPYWFNTITSSLSVIVIPIVASQVFGYYWDKWLIVGNILSTLVCYFILLYVTYRSSYTLTEEDFNSVIIEV